MVEPGPEVVDSDSGGRGESHHLVPLSYGVKDLYDLDIGQVKRKPTGSYVFGWNRNEGIFSLVPASGGSTRLQDLTDCEPIARVVNSASNRPFALQLTEGQFGPVEFIPLPLRETEAKDSDCDDLIMVGSRYVIGSQTRNAPNVFGGEAILVAVTAEYQIVYHPFTMYFRFKMTGGPWYRWVNVRTSNILENLLIDLRPTTLHTVMKKRGNGFRVHRINNSGHWYLAYKAIGHDVSLVDSGVGGRLGVSGGSLNMFPFLQKFRDFRVGKGTVMLDCLLEPGRHNPMQHITVEATAKAHVQIVILVTPIETGVHLRPSLMGEKTKIHGELSPSNQENFSLKNLSLAGVTLLSLRYTDRIANQYEIGLLIGHF